MHDYLQYRRHFLLLACGLWPNTYHSVSPSACNTPPQTHNSSSAHLQTLTERSVTSQTTNSATTRPPTPELRLPPSPRSLLIPARSTPPIPPCKQSANGQDPRNHNSLDTRPKRRIVVADSSTETPAACTTHESQSGAYQNPNQSEAKLWSTQRNVSVQQASKQLIILSRTPRSSGRFLTRWAVSRARKRAKQTDFHKWQKRCWGQPLGRISDGAY